MINRRLGDVLAVLIVALLFWNGPSRAQTWQVKIDPLTEMLENFREGIKQARVNVPVLVNGIGFDISRESGQATQEQKKAMINEWTAYLTKELRTRRFKRAPGNSNDMREQIINAQPYNERDRARERLGDFFVLTNEDSPPCDSGRGGMGAVVMSYYPTEGVRSDYGKIAVLLLGVGECGRARTANRNYMEQLVKRMEQLFTKKLGIQ